MKIRINGQDFIGFTEASVKREFLNCAGQFSFKTSPKDLEQSGYPIKVNQSCQVIVENEPFLTGYVESVDVHTSANDTYIEVSGRDRTADIVDSCIDNRILNNFNASTSLKTICETIINNLGISNIKVVDLVNPPLVNKFVAPSTGESAFDFIQKYSKQVQVLLTTDGLGNLVISKSIYDITPSSTLPIILLNQINGTANNILSGHFHQSTYNRFGSYRCYSQLAAYSFNSNDDGDPNFANVSADNYTDQIGDVDDLTMRSSRQLIFVSDTPIYNEGARNRAVWELNYRRAKSVYYNCQVSDHTYNGLNIWQPNNIVQVVDDEADLSAYLLIDSVEFVESAAEGEGGGQITTLNLVPTNSYSLQEQQNYQQSLSEKVGGSYFTSSN